MHKLLSGALRTATPYRRGLVALAALVSAFAWFTHMLGAEAPKVNDPVEGQKLARELRSTVPTEEIKFNGTLRISIPKSEPREMPIESKVVLSNESWSSVYTVKLSDGKTETLTVRHFPDKPNEYEWRRGEQTLRFNGTTATNSFAGSDFTLLDLGLEFFHWPTQLLATREMRKGRGCDVLESGPAQTNLYSRVFSWIDQQSREEKQPGLLMAEAFDSNGRILKEFEIKGFKDGQVSEMEIRNRQTKTSTRLRFLFDKE